MELGNVECFLQWEARTSQRLKARWDVRALRIISSDMNPPIARGSRRRLWGDSFSFNKNRSDNSS